MFGARRWVNLRFEGWNLGSVLALGVRFRVSC